MSRISPCLSGDWRYCHLPTMSGADDWANAAPTSRMLASTQARCRNAMFSFDCLDRELDDTRAHPVILDEQLADRHRQLEAARTGAAGIDVEHAVAVFDARLVRMAEHHHTESRCFRIDIEPGLVVPQVDRHRAEHRDLVLGYRPGPVTTVVVAAHRRDRRELPQPVEDFRLVDIAGVEDVVAAFKRCYRLVPHQAVGVRDEADAENRGGSQRNPVAWPPTRDIARSSACTSRRPRLSSRTCRRNPWGPSRRRRSSWRGYSSQPRYGGSCRAGCKAAATRSHPAPRSAGTPAGSARRCGSRPRTPPT